jgi:hypothetical protein
MNGAICRCASATVPSGSANGSRILGALLVATLCVLARTFGGRNASAQTACTTSSDDELIVEYFNEVTFNEEILVVVIDRGKSFSITLDCPDPDPFLPTGLPLRLAAADASQSASCIGGTIVIDKTQLKSKKIKFCSNGVICKFVATLSNSDTGAVYSETAYEITMTNGNSTFIPVLQPATLPMCGPEISACLSGTACRVSHAEPAELTLCESSGQCTSAPNAEEHGYNENAYFQLLTM